MNQKNVPYRREAFREKHAIIEFNSDFNMVDAGIMSSQSNSKDMAMLQAGIDSMTVQNDSVGRAYFKEAMNGTYKITADLKKADTLKIEQAHLGEYNVDSLFNVATLSQKQKIISTAVNRAESAGSDRYQSSTPHDVLAREVDAFGGMSYILFYRCPVGWNYP